MQTKKLNHLAYEVEESLINELAYLRAQNSEILAENKSLRDQLTLLERILLRLSPQVTVSNDNRTTA